MGVSFSLKSKNLIGFLLFLQVTVVAITLFDFPLARQVIGFVYFTIIPGFILTKLLRLTECDKLESILFSVGFSIAFLMFAGLFINESFLLLSLSKPLSPFPLLLILNSLIVICILLISQIEDNSHTTLLVFKDPKSFLALLFLILPILSIAGAIWVSAFGNNLILLVMIIVIALLFSVVGTVSKLVVSPGLYSIAVLMISISLLFHSSFISEHIVTFGSDIAAEYFVFKATQDNAYWSSIPIYPGLWYGRTNSMLSITILPTIYSTLLDINATQVLKVVYPLIFCFVPLILYKLWQERFGKRAALVATFLLMAQNTFYNEMVGITRQMIAEVFLVLLLLVMFNKKIRNSSKMLGFMTFSVALVTSHYALAVIFLSFISIGYISLVLMKRPGRNLTLTMIAFFLVAMFTWYIYTSRSSAFDSILSYGDYVFNQVDEFFNPRAARGGGVLLEKPPTVYNMVSRGFAYVTQFLIVIGFLGVATRRIRVKWEREYFTLTILAFTFLGAVIALPGLAGTLNMTRFYHILLCFLAPLCVLGAKFLADLVIKREEELAVSILLVIVLVPYFLFQTNFVYEVVGSESWSISLSSYRMDEYELYSHLGYIDVLSISGAEWIHRKVDIQQSQVYADSSSIKVLTTYGSIYGGNILQLSNTTVIPTKGIVYLNLFNTANETVVAPYDLYSLDELTFLNHMNKIYTNGASEIYKDMGKD